MSKAGNKHILGECTSLHSKGSFPFYAKSQRNGYTNRFLWDNGKYELISSRFIICSITKSKLQHINAVSVVFNVHRDTIKLLLGKYDGMFVLQYQPLALLQQPIM